MRKLGILALLLSAITLTGIGCEPKKDDKKGKTETKTPETKAPETTAPETTAPETKAPETTAPDAK